MAQMTQLDGLLTALRWTEAAAGLKPVVHAHYEGHQAVEGGPSFDLWLLEENIPGHPQGSTVSSTTLKAAGWALPNRRVDRDAI